MGIFVAEMATNMSIIRVRFLPPPRRAESDAVSFLIPSGPLLFVYTEFRIIQLSDFRGQDFLPGSFAY
jgi:hypothetical protein